MSGSQYCAPSDLGLYGLNAIALSATPMPTQTAACIAASGELDSYFRGRWPLPLLTWGPEVTKMAAYIAVHTLYDGSRGASPMRGSDERIETNYQAAIDWAKGVQRQTVHPDVTFTPQPQTYALPQVRSPNCDRGWGGRGIGS